MTYLALKHIHMSAIALSFLFFFVRGCLSFIASDWLAKRWLKVIPHIIDTVLLLSAFGLIYHIQQYPFVDHWLTAKLVALIIYIMLGVIALKVAKPAPIRALAFTGAILTFFYIVGAAIKHSPLSWIA